MQWRFSRDWQALRGYAHGRGIGLIGDLPIFLAHDSADVWLNRQQFYLDDAGEPTLVAGVPPDYFSATGQRWGNPLYRWAEMRATGFAWWIARFRATFALFDAVRLDHFIGYTRYWAIPAREPTAMNGRWRPGPGRAVLSGGRRRAGRAAAHRRGSRGGHAGGRVAAGALRVPGDQAPAVRVRDRSAGAQLLAAQLPARAVVYTGTHDNDTTAGWFHDLGSGTRSPEQSALERRTALRYLGAPDDDDARDDGREIHWRMIRAIMGSVANVAIVPAQDLLGLGSRRA